MKKNLFWILLSVLSCACSEPKPNVNVCNEYFLRGQEVKYDSANEDLWPMYIYGDAMIARSTNMNYYVGKIAKDEWQKSVVFLKNDEHNEVEFPNFFQSNKGKLFMLNQPMSGMKLSSLIKNPDADNTATILDQKKWKTYDLKKMQGVMNVASSSVVLSDTTILTALNDTNDIKRLFSILDFKNQKTIPLDYCLEDESPNDMVRWYNNVANCTILGNGKGHFLYKNPSAKDAFIFSIEGTHVNVLDTLYSYTYPPGKFTIERLSCCANNDRIYMLILDSDNKGEKLNDSDSKEPHPYLFGNTVEVYDWDGVKQEVIHLDNYAQRIMLSGDGNTLFLFAQTDEIIKPAIFSYDISNLEDNPMIDSVEIKKICKANLEKTLEKYGKKREDYLDEGDMMVDFELYDYDDKPHHLNEFLGKNKYTILEFSGIGCGPCYEARPHLEKFYKQNKGKLELVTVSVDKLSEWKKKPLGEVSWHEWNDHNLAIDIKKKYDVQGIPTFIIINPRGKIIKKLEGFTEGRIDEMKDIVFGKK